MIGIIMGSQSDLGTMRHAAESLESLEIPYELKILSAHRTPDAIAEYVSKVQDRGLKAIIAGAGGAAHLAGVVAAQTILPVFAVPLPSGALNGVDALYSMVQMPSGIPVGTLAIGRAGAVNAALLAAAVLALSDDALRKRLVAHRDGLRRRATSDNERLERAMAARAPGASLSVTLHSAGFKLDHEG